MLAKKQWFQRRKYGWWWITPKTWQGWVYIWVMTGFLLIFQSFWEWSDKLRLIITWIWLTILLIDIVPVMLSIDKDEREFKIEAISERNAAWFMVLILTFWILYDLIIWALQDKIIVNYFIVWALLGWALIKSISNFILERKWE